MKIETLAKTFLVSILLIPASCKKTDNALADKGAPGQPAAAEANSTAQANAGASSNAAPTVLVGVYTMSEIEQKGKITMVPPDFAVTFAFQPGGTFSRITKRGGQVVHTVGGDFQIAGKDELIINITLSEKDPVSAPKPKTYKFTLSKDAGELSLLGTDGKRAIFRKEAKGSPK